MRFFSGIGCMQGRLSPMLQGKIQSFPEKNWRKEFFYAHKLKLKFIEWTLDYKNLYKNPIFHEKNIIEIKKLCKKNSIKVISLTGDCFMQRPFWKIKNSISKHIINFKKIVNACNSVGIKFIVIPLVDKGSIKTMKQEKKIISLMKKLSRFIKKKKIFILFESDFAPHRLRLFIKKFDKKIFGINYDTGNSAYMGYNLEEEFKCYGEYIKGVHIKDRVFNGKSVRLGRGDVDFGKFFIQLKKINYKNHLILQTARSVKNKDIQEIKKNLEYIKQWIQK
jgi:hexulose-6-phosphate isomerase